MFEIREDKVNEVSKIRPSPAKKNMNCINLEGNRKEKIYCFRHLSFDVLQRFINKGTEIKPTR
jgi:hypothetical protein